MHVQRTIARPVHISGVGIHSGRTARAIFNPAPEDSGINFIRLDMDGETVPASSRFVFSTVRGTTLQRGKAAVSTVEHLLAAASILGVDNLTVEIDSDEVPILDGSAAPFVTLLTEAGLVEQKAKRKFLRLKEPVWLVEGEALLCAFPAEKFSLEILVNYPRLGPQKASLAGDDPSLVSQVAPARTFGFAEEVEMLRARGLALGGSLDNAVVFGPEGASVPLRFPDEPARHKLLDMLGDLALAGGTPLAAFTGVRNGHLLNTRMAAALIERSEIVA